MARKKIGHIELQWTCPNCGSLNSGPEKHCGNCGSPQPEDVEFTQAKRQKLIEDEDKLARARAGADIHCPYCGSRNSAEAEICHKCGGDLSEGVKRESGRVVGAFTTGPESPVVCPHCGSDNPDAAVNCFNCGGSLALADDLPQEPRIGETAPGGVSRSRLLIIAAVVVVLVIACGAFLLFANRTSPTTGVVEKVNWERSVPVEAIIPVEYQDWLDEVPAAGTVTSCEEQLRRTQNEPAPNSVETCGTPYTVDSGSGFAEVVQDCEYEIYDMYCSYTVDEWSVVDIALLTGSDYSPEWPEPLLEPGQRVGENWEEEFTIILNAGDEIYAYSTADFNLYQQAQIGSEWTLNINTFGQLMSIEKE